MSTALLSHKTVALMVAETTQSSAVSPAATDAILVSDLAVDPEVNQLERNHYRSTIGRLTSIPGETIYKVSFKTEIKGSGTAGTSYAPLTAIFQSMGYTATVTGGVSVVYAPTSAAASSNFFGPGKSMTINAYYDGVKHVIAGVMGTAKLSLITNQFAVLEYTGMGIYADPTDTAFPTQTYISQLPTRLKSSSFAFQSANLVINKLDIDLGVTVAKRVDSRATTGLQGFLVTNRDVRGSIDPEHELVATHAFFNKLTQGTTGTMTCTLGATAGNILTITAPAVQYTGVKYGDRDGIRTQEADFAFCESSGDDEIVFTLT